MSETNPQDRDYHTSGTDVNQVTAVDAGDGPFQVSKRHDWHYYPNDARPPWCPIREFVSYAAATAFIRKCQVASPDATYLIEVIYPAYNRTPEVKASADLTSEAYDNAE